MSDQSLRDALEKLAGEMEYDSSDGGRKIREVLAAWSVEPAPVRRPSDAAVEAAYEALSHGDIAPEEKTRAALDAAYRLDAPRPMLTREEIERVLIGKPIIRSNDKPEGWRGGLGPEEIDDIASAVLALLNGSGVDSSLHTCPGCGAKVIGHERCGDPTRPGCAS